MPDTLTPREIADLRQRLADSNGPDDDIGNAVFGGPEEAEEMAARLLAHLDALTAAVEKLPRAFDEAVNEKNEWPDLVWRSAVLAILRGEQPPHWTETPLNVSDPVVREAQVEHGDDIARKVAEERQ